MIMGKNKGRGFEEEQFENPFDDQKFYKLNDEQFEEEVNNLIEWCEDLDYDKYINNWHQLATSAYSGGEMKDGKNGGVRGEIMGMYGSGSMGEGSANDGMIFGQGK